MDCTVTLFLLWQKLWNGLVLFHFVMVWMTHLMLVFCEIVISTGESHSLAVSASRSANNIETSWVRPVPMSGAAFLLIGFYSERGSHWRVLNRGVTWSDRLYESCDQWCHNVLLDSNFSTRELGIPWIQGLELTCQTSTNWGFHEHTPLPRSWWKVFHCAIVS